MRRRVKTYGGYFESFLETLSESEVRKLDYIISLLESMDRIPSKFIKLIRNGLYELRMEFNSNIYRVFFIFDNDSIVILFNGFQKKTGKTPQKEIDKAFRIMEEYYADKQSSNSRL